MVFPATQQAQESIVRSIVKIGMWMTIALIVPIFAGCGHPGRKLLTLELVQDGHKVLVTTFDTADDDGSTELWDRLGEEPFASDENAAQVVPDKNESLHAQVPGKVTINIRHVRRIISSVSLRNLKLVRNTPNGSKWYLPRSEILRVKRAAGL